MKNWKMLFAVGFLSVLLTGCNAQSSEVVDETIQEQDLSEEGSSVRADEKNGTEEQSAGLRIYVNQTDAWKVDLPETWANVKIVEQSRSTDFIFPSQNDQLNQSLLYITSVTEQDWEKEQQEGPLGTRKEILRRDGDVFIFQTPLDMVLEGEEIAKYEKMVVEIPQIIESFQFE
ncbi:hypothetical protein [Bacillus sp. Marseille-P3661]|uniref:hypothetical protein n=1 Tax=Bacillus sp. Marseille-P3661 TaxID=1936234 RepID=UPI000C81D00B|nr:hypothetical protein [Bacillus sp. Marseille-P3661]